ncbi:calcium-binding protein [Humisphaera borealis]|uniref:Calcium-binding protein n=1 Tax=Humisphaera borealis TaxID=2807512 RepID=A0A7M2WSA7_9BACT|nr:calcium-binding protein [Humisphaera borealis]QOV88299.1 hypothetical protein IPV69_18895 [Humisphaera borealis]
MRHNMKAVGGRRQRFASVERLEQRQLLTTSLSAAGVLTVNGTALADAVTVNVVSGLVQVKEGGVVKGNFTPALVKSIIINGLAGNDSLQVFDAVTAPATLNGGDGDDFLRGGGGKDVLNGGNNNDVLDGGLKGDVFNGNAGIDFADYSARTTAVNVSLDGVANDGNPSLLENDNVMPDVENIRGGSAGDTLAGSALANILIGNGGNDTLRGGGGRDVLFGGNGTDTLNGDADDDLLIGSRTTYDTNVASLRVIGAEWSNPANSYATRISRLKAGTPGVKLDKTTVPADLATDTDTAGAGQDWFITHWGDLVKDRLATETVTLISSPIRFTSQTREVITSAGPDGFDEKKKSSTSLAAFTQTLASSFVDYPAMESAFGNASQTSSLSDTKLSFSGSSSASCFDSGGTGVSSFLVSFYLDEPRAYTLTYTWSREGNDGRSGVAVRLRRGATSLVDFVKDDGTHPNTVASKSGTLQPGQYTLELISSASAFGFENTKAGLSAVLTTTPAA